MDATQGHDGPPRLDLRRMDLNLLVSLHYLLQEHQVTAAADRMWVSQPSMSASLARLRRLLNDPLLVRAGRGLAPTPYAEGLREPLARILTEIELTLSLKPSFDPTAGAGTFVIATTDYITMMLLKSLVAELSDSTRLGIEIQPVVEGHIEDLRGNKIDMIIAPREVMGEVEDLASATLFLDRFVGVASADNPDVEPMSIDRFSSLPYVAYRSDRGRSNVDRQFDALGVSRAVQMTTESLVVVPFLVSGSNFIAMVHERLIRNLHETLSLRTFEPPVPLRPITHALYWHPQRMDDPAHRWLREQIVGLGRALQ